MQITKLVQEDSSGSSQVISFKELNNQGEMITKFETRFYQNYDALIAIQCIFSLSGDNESIKKYKAIELLSDCLYSGLNFQSAMQKRR